MLRRLLPLLLLAAAACDPCSGVGTCVAPQLRYEGVLTRKFGYPSGGPAEAVVVRFVRTGGVALDSDTLRAESDREGRFRIEGRADGEGQVTGDLLIQPPGPAEPIRVQGLRLATTRAPGEVLRLGEWEVDYPYLSYAAVLQYRATGQPAVGIEATFVRTGGIAIRPDTLRMTSDARGFLLIRPAIAGYGELTGDLTVYPPPPYRPIELRGLRFRAAMTERPDSIIRIGIGARLPYAIRFSWEDTGKGAGGVEVEFARTGGIPVSPERLVAKTDSFGTVHIDPVPLTSGEVVGDIIVRPPAPGRGYTVRGVRLATVEDDRHAMLIGFWSIPVSAPSRTDSQ